VELKPAAGGKEKEAKKGGGRCVRGDSKLWEQGDCAKTKNASRVVLREKTGCVVKKPGGPGAGIGGRGRR